MDQALISRDPTALGSEGISKGSLADGKARGRGLGPLMEGGLNAFTWRWNVIRRRVVRLTDSDLRQQR
jgi:hypothetical protein